jgi:hypothetical protein
MALRTVSILRMAAIWWQSIKPSPGSSAMSVRGDDTTEGGHALQQMLFGTPDHRHRAATIDLNRETQQFVLRKPAKELA